ncbi:ArnT family glycosyltransferase [Thermococcus sp.]
MDRMTRKLEFLLLTFIAGIYFIVRIPLLPLQNAYFDYDEGTYLLIARLINHGFLPYRDIFAVHPPLYYYALAGWLRVFGDNYLVGRIFSLILGFFSVIVAYLTGRELKGKELGVAFALLISLDPMAVKLNTLVLHGSMIELFTLLSLWFLVKYLKRRELKFAYASLAIAAIGSAAKFTIIPYLIALYVFLLFEMSEGLKGYLLGATNRIITAEQGRIIVITYLLWSAIIVTIGILIPTTLVRILTIVPGLHGIDKLGQVYTSILFLFFWLFITVYLFRIRYVRELPQFFIELAKSMKYVIILLSIVLLSKAAIEIPLGIMVSPTYLQQTYIGQSGRGFLFIGIFWFIHSVIATLQANRPYGAAYLLPTFLMISFLLILKQLKESTKVPKELQAFLFLNLLCYLIITPIIPDVRLIYPMFLVLYLAALYPLASRKRKHVTAIVLISAVLITANVGIDINYPTGKLAIASTPHIQGFRDDLGGYIETQNLSGEYLSINPMDAYYLKLTTIPYLTDTFGLGYLGRENLLNLLKTYSPKYLIIDTWMIKIMRNSNVLYKVYHPIMKYAVTNATLLFSESNPVGECVELFETNRTTLQKWHLNSLKGDIELYYNDISLINMTPELNGTQYSLEIKSLGNSTYLVKLRHHGKKFTGKLEIKNRSIILNIPRTVWNLEFDGVVMGVKNPIFNGNASNIRICTPRTCILARGNFKIKNAQIEAYGTIELTVER